MKWQNDIDTYITYNVLKKQNREYKAISMFHDQRTVTRIFNFILNLEFMERTFW